MARSKRSKTKADAVGQADPEAPLDSVALLEAATPVLARLEEDLLARAKSSPEVTRALEARYEAEKQAHRTAESFAGWSAALATQVAAAWLLSCVFVRTLEDRGLLKQARIAGPGAEDSQREFFKLAPSLSARDYLLTVFRELAHHPAAKDLFDVEHSLVWKLSPSADAVKDLLMLFRTPSAHEPSFRFGQPSTRFLGDLYQDISEDVRKRYALLQTPDFIEEFILDRTLEPAIHRFGLDDTTLIDPTCGSGHFLLNAFDRLFEHRLRAEPGLDARIAAVKALDCVYGADINPYAVAIARFRLTLSFLEKASYTKLADAPALPLHLVVADSLRINPQHPQQELWQQDGASSEHWLGGVFTLEDEKAARDVLFRQYAAVVGNPPYITVKDAALRDVYRAMYTAAAGKYALSAPFCERFFQLARPRGYTGQITSNSFMKREFGKPLIEEVLPAVNLELIVNTSGAYIPGHGTPTVLLFGTREERQATDVLAVLAKRGEPSTPADPRRGHVWQSIIDHLEEVGFDNDYISIARVEYEGLVKHPWSLGGGGAAELKELLEERAKETLGDVAAAIGVMALAGTDDVYIADDPAVFARHGIDDDAIRPLGIGENIRDWSANYLCILYPHNADGSFRPLPTAERYLWRYRTHLREYIFFGKTKEQRGLDWRELGAVLKDKLGTRTSIVFAFVATHNHFVLDRDGRVFNRSAPIIKLPEKATGDEHLALLAYLNSSTACFWMKQVLFVKASGTNVGDMRGKPERLAYEFSGTALEAAPVPVLPERAVSTCRELERLAIERQCVAPGRALTRPAIESSSAAVLAECASEYESLLERMIVLQEELDWETYVAFGLADESLLAFHRGIDLEGLRAAPDARPFQHRLPPAEPLAALWEDRRTATLASAELSLLEQPLFKRPWLGVQGVFHRDGWTYEALTEVAIYESIARVAEDVCRKNKTTPLGRGDVVRDSRCERLMGLRPNPSANETDLFVAALLEREAVPFSPAAYLSESGLVRRAEWEVMWSRQRDEDRGTSVDIEPAGKYATKDFRDGNWYRLRGPLDVPKERFISYPFCESDTDGEPLYGWAGWDHLQRAQALGALYLNRRDAEGWTAERLTPMLAGLLELIPWVKQWHNEPSEEFGGLRMGDYYQQFLDEECRRHSLTHDDLRAWRPPKKTRAAKKPAKAKAADGNGAGASDEAPAKPKRARKKKTDVVEAAEETE